jgi:hypothetical protein
MKKLAILVCGILVIGLSSCGNDSSEASTQCTCVAHYSGTGSEGMSDITTTIDSNGAKCSSGNSTTTVGTLTLTVTCK